MHPTTAGGRFALGSYCMYDVPITTHTDAHYMSSRYGIPTDDPDRLPFWMIRWTGSGHGKPGGCRDGRPGGLPQAELSYALSAYNHLGKVNIVSKLQMSAAHEPS